jgi:hypothetical protein
VTLARLTTGGVAVLCLVFATGAAHADDGVAALRANLDQIKQRVAEFETRLSALEAEHKSTAQLPQTGATLAPSAGPAPASAPASAPVPAASVPPTATQPAAADAPVVVPRAQWRHVQAGLTMDEVNGLIGAPTKTFELSGKTVWYYYYPAIGAGSVFFDAHGRASSVQRPAGGS